MKRQQRLSGYFIAILAMTFIPVPLMTQSASRPVLKNTPECRDHMVKFMRDNAMKQHPDTIIAADGDTVIIFQRDFDNRAVLEDAIRGMKTTTAAQRQMLFYTC